MSFMEELDNVLATTMFLAIFAVLFFAFGVFVFSQHEDDRIECMKNRDSSACYRYKTNQEALGAPGGHTKKER
jgi:hypothetical protein